MSSLSSRFNLHAPKMLWRGGGRGTGSCGLAAGAPVPCGGAVTGPAGACAAATLQRAIPRTPRIPPAKTNFPFPVFMISSAKDTSPPGFPASTSKSSRLPDSKVAKNGGLNFTRPRGENPLPLKIGSLRKLPQGRGSKRSRSVARRRSARAPNSRKRAARCR